jgi:hypothetical protein
MSSKSDLRALAPQGRVVERRTRRRVVPSPSEVFMLYLVTAPLVAAVQAGARLLGQLARRARLEALPRVDGVSAPLAESLASPEAAEEVRVHGWVEALAPPFETPGSTVPAVFARSIFATRPAYQHLAATYNDETRGVDFQIRLPSGEVVQLNARQVRLHDSPTRVWRPNLVELARRGGDLEPSLLLRLPPLVRELAVHPGDRVEAAGVLVREVAPMGQAVLGRGTPLVTRLCPSPGASHVWLRLV